MGRAATRRASATEGSRPAADPWGRSSFSASFSPYALVTRETEPRPPRRRVDSLAKRTEYLRRSSALAAGSFGRYAGSKPLTRTRRERGAPPCSVTEPPRLPGLIFKASGDGRTKAGKSKVIQFLLLMLCALGGSIGGFLAMAVTGTKQGIDYFKLRVPLLIIPNAVCLVLLGVA